MQTVNTAAGAIEIGDLGVVLMHEHVVIMTTEVVQNYPEGWGDGEKQAAEIFLSDLGRLQRDIVGMARYRVLLRAGLVEQPRVSFDRRRVEGGGDMMRVGDTTIRITGQPGLQSNARRWTPTGACAQ